MRLQYACLAADCAMVPTRCTVLPGAVLASMMRWPKVHCHIRLLLFGCQVASEVELDLAVRDAACDTPTQRLWTAATPTSISSQSAVLASSPALASAADASAASQAAAAATAAAAADHDAAYAAAAKRWTCPSPEISETPSIADTPLSQFSR